MFAHFARRRTEVVTPFVPDLLCASVRESRVAQLRALRCGGRCGGDGGSRYIGSDPLQYN